MISLRAPHIGLARQKVVDAMLGGNTTRDETGPAGRTDGNCDEKILESNAACRKAVDVRRPNLRVSVTSCCPDTLTVSEDEYDVGFLCVRHRSDSLGSDEDSPMAVATGSPRSVRTNLSSVLSAARRPARRRRHC